MNDEFTLMYKTSTYFNDKFLIGRLSWDFQFVLSQAWLVSVNYLGSLEVDSFGKGWEFDQEVSFRILYS